MKKLFVLTAIFTFFSCNNGFDDIINDYKTKPKSQELVGFWKLKGIYPPNSPKQNAKIEIFFNSSIGLVKDEILFLDLDYLRFLNKSAEGNDTLYYYNTKNKFYWYNVGTFIKTLHQSEYNSENFQNIREYQFPYKFGQTKDTLILQHNGNIFYLLKQISVEYKEYAFD